MLQRTFKLSHKLGKNQVKTLFADHKVLFSKSFRLIGSASGNCWKCGASNSVMFCHHCNCLQKPNKTLNYFNLFGLTPTFDIEIANLAKEYRQLQSRLHPDKFANASEDERVISEEYSSVINKAYSILQQPLTRGLYMLELNGIYLEEGNVQSDPEFLMDLMERNEEVDKAESESEIKRISEKNKYALERLISSTSQAFSAGDLNEAKVTLTKIKYFSSIEEKIKVLKIRRGYVE